MQVKQILSNSDSFSCLHILLSIEKEKRDKHFLLSAVGDPLLHFSYTRHSTFFFNFVIRTNDAGRTIAKKNKEFNEKMKESSIKLNLKGHTCGGVKGRCKRLHSAADIEGHYGIDKKVLLSCSFTSFSLLKFSFSLPFSSFHFLSLPFTSFRFLSLPFASFHIFCLLIQDKIYHLSEYIFVPQFRGADLLLYFSGS